MCVFSPSLYGFEGQGDKWDYMFIQPAAVHNEYTGVEHGLCQVHRLSSVEDKNLKNLWCHSDLLEVIENVIQDNYDL